MLVEMSITGLMVDPITNMPIVILHDSEGQRVLPIWVGLFEANAIALQIENISMPRPTGTTAAGEPASTSSTTAVTLSGPPPSFAPWIRA